jgi:hypothetical protein
MSRPAQDSSSKDPTGPDSVPSVVRLDVTGSVHLVAIDFSSTDRRYWFAGSGNPFQLRFPLKRSSCFVVPYDRSTELQICAASKISWKK